MSTRHISIMRPLLLDFLLVAALFMTGCDDCHWFWNGWDLEGCWKISEIGYDNSVIFSYEVYIDQHGMNIEIDRDGEQLSKGSIWGNRIHCDDWYDYDINTIYIDSEWRMHSEEVGRQGIWVLEFGSIELNSSNEL